ncbi:LysR family transcriptional regulator ArgP [Cellulomonas sp. HZM]|uniref:LysR family transcriptional regulator ArgP n=1 Tax=Cellulomonas sp. HZM TaxID=1454010 RepID=UPI000ADFBB84|nr:LysR family transcriptional regulator ArgP [Cellulomonas sp. HZM]
MDPDQLRALAAVVAEGSFDAAALVLGVTPSAVSQRIKALEQSVGSVLVRRSRPCAATEPGQVLVRLAGQLDLLERDARAAIGGASAGGPTTLPVAVNADSLSTWFPTALEHLPDDVLVDLWREDQDHSARLLRDGTVMAAVTADSAAVQGCRVLPLGAMRYVGVVAPDRWQGALDAVGPSSRRASSGSLSSGSALAHALERVPAVAFNRQDALPDRFARLLVGRRVPLRAHRVPSNGAYVATIVAGLGWGVAPRSAVQDLLATGALVEISPGTHLDVPLHWQHWALSTPTLDDLTRRVRAAAGVGLEQVGEEVLERA